MYLISHCPFAKFLSVEIHQFAVWLVVWYLLERSEFVDITLGQTEINRSFSGSQHFLDCPNTLFPQWKVIGYARKSRDKKIKRKPFEMSIVSVFCQIEKMQMTT